MIQNCILLLSKKIVTILTMMELLAIQSGLHLNEYVSYHKLSMPAVLDLGIRDIQEDQRTI